MADFPKKQQQCLIPKYLLDYLGQLDENHPDPSAEWGGSGVADIEAGTGIEITGETTKTISVDDETVAMVANLDPVAFSGSYNDLSNKPDLSVYELKEDAFSGDYDDLTNKPDLSIYETKAEAFSGNYNDLTNKPDLTVYELKSEAFSGDYDDLSNKPDLSVYAETADLGDCAYLDENELSIAYSQITGTPTIPTKTSELTNDSGFITNADISHMVTDNTAQTITGAKTFAQWLSIDGMSSSDDVRIYNGGKLSISDNDPMLNYSLEMHSDSLLYNSYNDHTTSVNFVPPSNDNSLLFPDKSGTLAVTSDIITSYNDLTDKPTIPTVGNGTITIKKNNTTVDKFTTNQSTNKSINITVPTDTSDLTNGAGFITNAALTNCVKFKTVSDNALIDAGNYYGPGYEPGLTSYNFITRTQNTFKLPISKSGTIALTNDIPTVPTNVSAFTNDAGYITAAQVPDGLEVIEITLPYSTQSYTLTAAELAKVQAGCIILYHRYMDPQQSTDFGGYSYPRGNYALYQEYIYDDIPYWNRAQGNVGPSMMSKGLTITGAGVVTYRYDSNTQLAKVAATGSYNDLSNKPSIPSVGNGTITIQKNGTAVDTFTTNQSSSKSINITVPTAVSDLTNDSGFITGITSSDVTTALGYTPGTSNFSGAYADLTGKPTLATVATTGSYDDLTNKPTIPTVNDNTITITQGGVTKGSFTLNQNTNQTIEVDNVPDMIGEVIYDQPAGESRATSLTMAHSFADYSYVDIQYRILDSADYVQSARIYDPNGKMVSLDWKFNTDWANANIYGKCARYTLNGNIMTVNSDTGYEYYNNRMGSVTKNTYQYQILITKVIGYKANSSPLTSETWTFTLQDGTTTTKKIMLG